MLAADSPNPFERGKPSVPQDGSNADEFDKQQFASLLDTTRAGKDTILSAIHG
jgi:hypothetical protein